MSGRFFPDAPTFRQMPRVVLHAILFGAAIGPFVSLLLAWLMQAPWDRIFRKPLHWLLGSMLVGAIFSLTFYFICGLPLGYVRRRLLTAPGWYAKTVTGLAGLACGMLGCVIAFGSIRLVFGSGVKMIVPLSRVAVIDGIIAMIVALALNAWGRLQAEKKLAASRAQSKALQDQINPHFFFNTLNTISALIPVDPQAAQRTLGQLADLSRYAFSIAHADTVPLAEEVEFARTYLQIEKARFGDRLRFELPDAPSVKDISLPALTLQPLIENAVRYGIAPSIDGGMLWVRIHRTGARYTLTVENETDVPQAPDSVFFRPDHALSNIRERLQITYNGEATLKVAAPRPNLIAVTIDAPVRP